MISWIRCLSILALLFQLTALPASNLWTEDPTAPSPPPFTLDDTGLSQQDADFPYPQVLEDLREAWHREFLDNYPGYAEMMKGGADCGLAWMYHLDFDGDQTEETFFGFGMNGYGIYPSAWLCFMDSAGNVTKLDESSIFEGKVIRYPGRAQLCCTSFYSTGSSLRGRVVGYQDGKVVDLLQANTADFHKEGPYLVSTPRVGAAEETVVCIYQWDEAAKTYRWISPVEIPLEALPEKVREIAAQQTGTLTRAAQYALPYFLLGFDDPNGERVLYVRREPDGTYRTASWYYTYSFDRLLNYLGEGDVSDPIGI